MRVIAINSATTARTETLLLQKMHELRAKVFGNRLRWDVQIAHNQERDEYDLLDPAYLVVVGDDEGVIGCVRLLPSTGPTMLGQTFPYLIGSSRRPCSRRIVESSRFCIDTERSGHVSASGLREATHSLFAGIIEWSLANGYDKIVTVTDIRFERILLRAKWPLERLGYPHPVGNTMAVAGVLPADSASFDLVRPTNYEPMFPTTVHFAA